MTVAWRKSSHSGAGGTGECVELTRFANGIGVRDSKAPDSGHLIFSVNALAQLIAKVKREDLNA